MGLIIITATEFLLYVLIILLMHLRLSVRVDFVIVMLFFIALGITLSQTSYSKNIKINLKDFGIASLIIFLGDVPARYIVCLMYSDVGLKQRILPAVIALIVVVFIILKVGNFLKINSRILIHSLSKKCVIK